MSPSVVTVNEGATFHEIAALMRRHQVSALPVVDLRGRVVGIVSEADLMPKEASPVARHLWQRTGSSEERAKTEGVTAVDIMSSPVVSAKVDEPLASVARRLLDHNVKRLPVLAADGTLIGIVSRRDVLRVFTRADEEIRRDIVEGVLPHWMGLDPRTVDVAVSGGVVLLRGGVERRSEIEVLTHLIAGLDGVVAVTSELRYSMDDVHVRPPVEAHVT
ncbi:MAG: CBS domain-containing protein [Candidatus Dormibacteraeota bacterium]|nr:CBS domain-containing protein [Candidatus Dormibacteraeota bacterium]